MNKQRVCIITLGCPRNYVDTQTLALYWIRKGFSITNFLSEADIVVINTCGFIEPAVKESIDVILSLEEAYNSGKVKEVWIVGCLVERYGEELKKEFPWAKFCGCLSPQNLAIKPPIMCEGGFAYVKICEGCVSNCSFCVIPKIRGSLESRKIEDIINEINYVVSCGKNEVVLVGQDTTAYGLDLYGKYMLEELIKVILSYTDVKWLRLMYAYPSRISESLLNLIAKDRRIVSYLDIPIQHTEDRILKLMKRNYTKDNLKRLLRMCEDLGIAVRTTVMVGFPQETRSDFSNMKMFLQEQGSIVRLGVFKFYPEEGTLAYHFSGQVSDSTKRSRYYALRKLSKEIIADVNEFLSGEEIEVIIDAKYVIDSEEGNKIYIGRTPIDAPEVDLVVQVISKGKELFSGDIVKVRLSLQDELLIGQVIEDEE